MTPPQPRLQDRSAYKPGIPQGNLERRDKDEKFAPWGGPCEVMDEKEILGKMMTDGQNRGDRGREAGRSLVFKTTS